MQCTDSAGFVQVCIPTLCGKLVKRVRSLRDREWPCRRCISIRQNNVLLSADSDVGGVAGCALSGIQITWFGTIMGGCLGGQDGHPVCD
jgi:hypothetical protein